MFDSCSICPRQGKYSKIGTAPCHFSDVRTPSSHAVFNLTPPMHKCCSTRDTFFLAFIDLMVEKLEPIEQVLMPRSDTTLTLWFGGTAPLRIGNDFVEGARRRCHSRGVQNSKLQHVKYRQKTIIGFKPICGRKLFEEACVKSRIDRFFGLSRSMMKVRANASNSDALVRILLTSSKS